MPLQGGARKQHLRGTGRGASCEVIPLCNTTGAPVQLKKFIAVIHPSRVTEVTLFSPKVHVAIAVSALSSVRSSAASVGNSAPSIHR